MKNIILNTRVMRAICGIFNTLCQKHPHEPTRALALQTNVHGVKINETCNNARNRTSLLSVTLFALVFGLPGVGFATECTPGLGDITLNGPNNTGAECGRFPAAAPSQVSGSTTCDCGGLNIDEYPTEFEESSGCAGPTLIRRWSATDGCGNTQTFRQQLTSFDDTAPTLFAPDDKQLQCDMGTRPEDGHTGNAFATDNCSAEDLIVLTYDDNDQTGLCGAGTITREWKARDKCNNSSSSNQIITVFALAPTINVPDTVTRECMGNINTDPANPFPGIASGTNRCDGSSLVATHNDSTTPLCGANSNAKSIERTWSVSACNFTTTETQTIKIEDTKAPVLSALIDFNITCNEIIPFSKPLASDNCSFVEAMLESTDTDRNLCGAGSITRYWRASDGCNSTTESQTIEISQIRPVISVDNQESSQSCSLPKPQPDDSDVRVTELCINGPAPIKRNTPPQTISGSCIGESTVKINWFAEQCGMLSEGVTQTINIVDNEGPELRSLVDHSADCNTTTDPEITGEPQFRDNCDPNPTVFLPMDNRENFDPICNAGVIKRSWRARDSCLNASDEAIQTLTYFAKEPIIIGNHLTSHSCEINGNPVTKDDIGILGQIRGYNQCNFSQSVDLTWSSREISLDSCGTDILTRTYKATACGLSATKNQTIQILNNIAPTFTVEPSDELAVCDPLIPNPDNRPTATHPCVNPAVLHVDNKPELEDRTCKHKYDFTRTWTAYGGAPSCTTPKVTRVQNVTVNDNVKPKFTSVLPQNTSVQCKSDVLSPGTLSARDNCDGDLALISGSQFPDDHPVLCDDHADEINQWEAVDSCGNRNTHLQGITIKDTIAPDLTVPDDKTVLCKERSFDTGIASATDNCDGSIIAEHDPGFNESGLNICGNGTITLGFTATDMCGNESSGIQTLSTRDCGDIELDKTTNGVLTPSQFWRFTLGLDDSILFDENLDTGKFFSTFDLLSVSGTYELCELNIPAGATATFNWDSNQDGTVDALDAPVNVADIFNPNAPSDVGNRCLLIGDSTSYPLLVNTDPSAADQDSCKLFFAVDNVLPKGDPRTPGYWKNWSTCTNGNQVATAANNGGCEEGFCLLDDFIPTPGIALGVFDVESCDDAVSILNHRALNNNKVMANDGVYKVARNLLAAKLNVAALALTCDAALDAIDAADELLKDEQYDGSGRYLKPNSAGREDAIALAGVLDSYNNGTLCVSPLAAQTP